MKPRIVILGGGFAGAYCAQALSKAVGRGELDVTVVDRNNYFVFYPLLVEAGTGNLHPRHAVVSIRAFTGACTFRMGDVTHVDFPSCVVTYRLGGSEIEDRLPYDHLVLAVGSVTRLPSVPGLLEHAFEIKSLADAVALRDHAIRMLEIAEATPDRAQRRSLLHFIVVGGSFTGVEVAGEFHAYLHEACKSYRSLDPGDCKVTLIEIANRILPALDEDLSHYAATKMKARGIEILLKTSVASIDREGALLSDSRRLDAHTVIWCAGIAPSPLVRSFELPVDSKGYVLCEPSLRVKGFSDVWAIGDVAVNLDPNGVPYPPTAQHAVRQGGHLARNLCRVVAGEEPRPFVFKSLGSLAAIGCRTGVAKILGCKLSGFPAWFLWRTVYLLKMPGLARKVRVVLDWSVDLFFRRDFVQLGVQRRASEAVHTGAGRPADPASRPGGCG
ncbi:MAG: NAD(P)/FAD-dependent oxidoreductase [Planctomycetota bacterium]